MGQSRNYRARRRAAIHALLGGVCAKCGISDPRVLQVDHIHRATEHRNRSTRSGVGLWSAILRGDKLVDDFQLLCCNCHFIKKLENKEFYPVHKTESQSPQRMTRNA